MSHQQTEELRGLLREILRKQLDPKDLLKILDDIRSGQIRIENGVVRIEQKVEGMTHRYWPNGQKLVQGGPGQMNAEEGEQPAFNEIQAAANAQDWKKTIELCQKEIAKVPEWLTPYFYLGGAYLNTGQHDQALAPLRKFVTEAGPSGYDDSLVARARLWLEQLRKTQ
jgi:tetratricopeptide (TPR) repeat protein